MSPAVSSHRRSLGVTFAFSLALVGSLFSQDRFPDNVTAKSPAPRNAPPNAKTPADNLAPVPRAMPPAPTGAATSRFAAVAAIEAEDFGVPAASQLHGDPMHAPTPTRIEGASAISTEALYAMTQQKDSAPIIFDVLGGERGLPGARNAQPAGSNGTFTDATQRDFGNYLQQVTQGKRDLALIFYCQNVYCWRSYNAALRAIKLGYTRVYWYRGGIDAWTQAGLSTHPRQ